MQHIGQSTNHRNENKIPHEEVDRGRCPKYYANKEITLLIRLLLLNVDAFLVRYKRLYDAYEYVCTNKCNIADGYGGGEPMILFGL